MLQYGVANDLINHYPFCTKARILDIGCRDGRITAEIAQKAPESTVVGVDASPSMIEFAQENFPKSKFPNLEFILEKSEDLIFPYVFDTIVSFNCFHWVREAKKALSQLCASLKPKGELLILTYPKESIYYEFLQAALEGYPDYVHLSACHTMLPIKEYEKILKNSGMEIQDFSSRDVVASYENDEAIKDFIRGWLTSFVPLPQHLHEEFLDRAVMKAIPYHINNKNKMINLPYTELTIRAKRN